MSNCCSCKYAEKHECGGAEDYYAEWYCIYDKDVKGKITIIPHPHFMGGKRRCLCYKKREKEYDVFVYPTPNEVNK